MQKSSAALTLVLLLCGSQAAVGQNQPRAPSDEGQTAGESPRSTVDPRHVAGLQNELIDLQRQLLAHQRQLLAANTPTAGTSPSPVDRGRADNPAPSWAWGGLLAIGFVVALCWCITSVIEARARKRQMDGEASARQAQIEREQRPSLWKDLIEIDSKGAKTRTETALETFAKRLEEVAEKTTNAANRVHESLRTADGNLTKLATSLSELEQRVKRLERPATDASGSADGESKTSS